MNETASELSITLNAPSPVPRRIDDAETNCTSSTSRIRWSASAMTVRGSEESVGRWYRARCITHEAACMSLICARTRATSQERESRSAARVVSLAQLARR